MYEQSQLKLAITEWQAEVDAVTVLLIEAGVPPYEAEPRAVETVSNRRRQSKMGEEDKGG